MVIVVALVIAVGVAVLVWRAFGPERLGVEGRRDSGPTPSGRRHSQRGRPVGPDDDVDFLLDLDREHRRARPTSEGEAEDPRS